MVFLVLWDVFDLKQPKFSWGAGGHFGSVVRGSLDPPPVTGPAVGALVGSLLTGQGGVA